MTLETKFDRDYFENGVEKRISGYTNYHWMPDRSFPEAVELFNRWGNKPTVLDYGCAKGYMVAAMRKLGMKAFGEDISTYALENAHPDVKAFLSLPSTQMYDHLVCKDVMEHVPEQDVPKTLQYLGSKLNHEGLFVIPLGDDNKFRIREYELDVTHVTKKDEGWWVEQLRNAGLNVTAVKYKMGAMKEKWVEQYPYGNGFFWVRP